jgi:hypothetical protein
MVDFSWNNHLNTIQKLETKAIRLIKGSGIWGPFFLDVDCAKITKGVRAKKMLSSNYFISFTILPLLSQ